MTKQLLRHITLMCLFLILGMMYWITAPLVSQAWIFILNVVAAPLSFFLAYICYRRARKIAEALDKPKTFEVVITKLLYDEALQPETKETEEEHEDTGFPI